MLPFSLNKLLIIIIFRNLFTFIVHKLHCKVDRIFKSIIGIHMHSVTFKTVISGSCNDEAVLLYDEHNVLRYAAGYIYVYKCLRNQLNSYSHPLKSKLIWRYLI